MSNDAPKEYNLSMHTNDAYSAIAQTAAALYELVEETLQMHEDHEAEECEFELFAHDLLAVLTRHADQMVNDESPSDELDDLDQPTED